MKTIDVRIGCSDQFQVFVHDVLLAVEKEYPVTAQITVTELPPPQGEDEGSSCCERCRSNDGHCAHYKIGLHRCLYFTPAVSSPPPRVEIEERICLTCRRKTCDRQPEDVDLANCPDWQPAAPVAPRIMQCPNHSTCKRTDDGIGAHCDLHAETDACKTGCDGCPPCVPAAPGAPAVEKIKFKTGCEIVGCDEYDKINGICLHDGECKYRTPTPCPSCERIKGEKVNLIRNWEETRAELQKANLAYEKLYEENKRLRKELLEH